MRLYEQQILVLKVFQPNGLNSIFLYFVFNVLLRFIFVLKEDSRDHLLLVHSHTISGEGTSNKSFSHKMEVELDTQRAGEIEKIS